MEPKTTVNKKVNGRITQRIVALHQQGWDNDFFALNNNVLVNVQRNENHNLDAVHIELIDLNFDVLSKSFKYIYTIETFSGERGLLILDAIVTNKFIA
ncbi:hypothetical protein SNE25_19905 [Mucilaginibacter sabulilitoris]|uniref:Uncharacterized protein n=1 Tax=Mucilaginibacter sabulilitoris TaxID=1173583 RepID=A0ABZ0TFP4_9SPHI|nr:hypothetical protein [Mucilaginibacter sabulilitoris]WPU91584.1 hypothetical protein SNE25_19905 [Mucilaginibacter sabulilitoris]